MEGKKDLKDYIDQIKKESEKAAHWSWVAFIGMCMSVGFMVGGIVLQIIMGMKGIG